MDQTKDKFSAINLDEKVIESITKNKKVVAKLSTIVDMAGGKADKAQGNLLYSLATKLPPSCDSYTQSFVNCIMANKWTKQMQLDEAIGYLKERLADQGASF